VYFISSVLWTEIGLNFYINLDQPNPGHTAWPDLRHC